MLNALARMAVSSGSVLNNFHFSNYIHLPHIHTHSIDRREVAAGSRRRSRTEHGVSRDDGRRCWRCFDGPPKNAGATNDQIRTWSAHSRLRLGYHKIFAELIGYYRCPWPWNPALPNWSSPAAWASALVASSVCSWPRCATTRLFPPACPEALARPPSKIFP